MKRGGVITRDRRRRGGILLEVVVSVALFAGAAAFTLACVRSVFVTLERTRRQQQIIDMARSKLGELEAGMITMAELRAGWTGGADTSKSSDPSTDNFILETKVSRSEFTGLSLVELTVSEPVADDVLSYTLRQLMPLREEEAGEFERDE